jgi:hypothetical protein
MEQLLESNNTAWPFPFTQQEWDHTAPTVQASLRTRRNEDSCGYPSAKTLRRIDA